MLEWVANEVTLLPADCGVVILMVGNLLKFGWELCISISELNVPFMEFVCEITDGAAHTVYKLHKYLSLDRSISIEIRAIMTSIYI